MEGSGGLCSGNSSVATYYNNYPLTTAPTGIITAVSGGERAGSMVVSSGYSKSGLFSFRITKNCFHTQFLFICA